MLHAFGRHTLGFKWAGELDVLDATAHAQTQYPIDAQRIALGGFSMGGAGSWHIGAHYPTPWCVVQPGAGFVLSDKTREFDAGMPRGPGLAPEFVLAEPSLAACAPPHEKSLWGLYDVPDYARSLLNTPLVVYSGELDAQMAPARVMEPVLQRHGLRFAHVVGPAQGHRFDEASLAEVMSRCARHMAAGRGTAPDTVHIQTKTLRCAYEISLCC